METYLVGCAFFSTFLEDFERRQRANAPCGR